MRWLRRLAGILAVGVALAVASGAAALTPARTIVAALPVQDLALTGRSVAYVADAPVRLECARIGFWNTATNQRLLFDAKEQCLELGSTGQGVWDVAVATRRLLWLTYAGGNFREWTLWTATTTKRKPRQLRFVARDVDAPAPIVIGPGTAEGIPYAVDRQIVYLGDDGHAIFKTTVASPVREIASGHGGSLRVAALLADGTIVGLDRDGVIRETVDEFRSASVPAIRVSGLGLAIQSRASVHLPDVTVTLPFAAVMVDVAQGRILWARSGGLGATSIATGESIRLVDGTQARPFYGQLEPGGLAWARGKLVRWRAGVLP
jgi:hypothetical protein